MRSAGVIGLLVGLAVALVGRRQLDVVEVRGRSMAPTLLPGERLVTRRAAPRVDDVVLAPDPRDPRRELIKRVATLDAGGARLRGDNPAASTDARAFGAIPVDAIEWRVVLRYWPPRRIGRIAPAPTVWSEADQGGEPACAVPDALISGDAGATVSRG